MRERYLFPTARGERESCFAQTEPEAGSDPGAMRTTAVRDGDHYVINGTKRFITGADVADFIILMAATDRSKGSHGGISCFVLDKDTPGRQAHHLLPDAHRRDAVGDRVRQRAHPQEPPRRQGRQRLRPRPDSGSAPAASSRAPARSAPPAAASSSPSSYAKQRTTFGAAAVEPAGDPVAAGRHLRRARSRDAPGAIARQRDFDRGDDDRNEAYLVKLYCTEMAWEAADMCLQVHGGIGLTTDLPVERLWRDQRSHMITEGTPEIMRMALARHVLSTFG